MPETWMVRYCPSCGGRASTPTLTAEGDEVKFGCCGMQFMIGRRASVIAEVATAMYNRENGEEEREW